jgi:hypothetical protein
MLQTRLNLTGPLHRFNLDDRPVLVLRGFVTDSAAGFDERDSSKTSNEPRAF